MNNASLETADRRTHVKIVAVSLVASIAILVGGIVLRGAQADSQTAQLKSRGPVIKAGPSVTATRADSSVVR
jgi:hypothetical protein